MVAFVTMELLKTLVTAQRLGSLLLLAMSFSSTARANSFSLSLGPPGVGGGGTNPIGLPPGIIDVDAAYETSDGLLYSASIAPGIFAGKRFYQDEHNHLGFFGGLGAGLVINVKGLGPGGYSSLGYLGSINESFRVLLEFKQALGVNDGLMSPYALRCGVWYDL